MAYRIKPRDRTAQAALRRIACSQIDRAIAEIDAAGLPRDEVVHRVRRRVKKLRALLRIVRPHFDRYRAESIALRDIARLLSPSRDAAVMRQTLDRLMRAPELALVPGDAAWLRIGEDAGADVDIEAALATVRERFDAARDRVAGWTLDTQRLDAIAEGLETSYRRARKAMAAAEAEPERLHEWRKRVKAHGFHRLLLRRALPGALRADRAWLDELGELLGDLNDLAMLRARVRATSDAPPQAARLLAAIGRRERELTASALDAGARLFRRKPKVAMRGVRRRLAAM